jgi:hypothetical protein
VVLAEEVMGGISVGERRRRIGNGCWSDAGFSSLVSSSLSFSSVSEPVSTKGSRLAVVLWFLVIDAHARHSTRHKDNNPRKSHTLNVLSIRFLDVSMVAEGEDRYCIGLRWKKSGGEENERLPGFLLCDAGIGNKKALDDQVLTRLRACSRCEDGPLRSEIKTASELEVDERVLGDGKPFNCLDRYLIEFMGGYGDYGCR